MAYQLGDAPANVDGGNGESWACGSVLYMRNTHAQIIQGTRVLLVGETRDKSGYVDVTIHRDGAVTLESVPIANLNARNYESPYRSLELKILKALVVRKAALRLDDLDEPLCDDDASVVSLQMPLLDIPDPERFQGMDFVVAALAVAYRDHPIELERKTRGWWEAHMPAWWLCMDSRKGTGTTLCMAQAGLGTCPELVPAGDDARPTSPSSDGRVVDIEGRLWIPYTNGGIFCPESGTALDSRRELRGESSERAKRRSDDWQHLRRQRWVDNWDQMTVEAINLHFENQLDVADRAAARTLMTSVVNFILNDVISSNAPNSSSSSTSLNSSSSSSSVVHHDGDPSVKHHLHKVLTEYQTSGSRTCRWYDYTAPVSTKKTKRQIQEGRFEGRLEFRNATTKKDTTYYQFDVGDFVRQKCIRHGWNAGYNCKTCQYARLCPICNKHHDSRGNKLQVSISIPTDTRAAQLDDTTTTGRVRCWRWVTLHAGESSDKSIQVDIRL